MCTSSRQALEGERSTAITHTVDESLWELAAVRSVLPAGQCREGISFGPPNKGQIETGACHRGCENPCTGAPWAPDSEMLSDHFPIQIALGQAHKEVAA